MKERIKKELLAGGMTAIELSSYLEIDLDSIGATLAKMIESKEIEQSTDEYFVLSGWLA